jgi:predicted MPP superfamily phosphohydrolase
MPSLTTETVAPKRVKHRFLRRRGAAAKKFVRSVLPERNAPHLKGGISIFVTSVIMLEFVMLILHFMIYETLVTAFGIGSPVLKIVLGFLSITFISASILAAKLKGPLVTAYYRLAGFWFAFVPPLSVACFTFALIENISFYFFQLVPPAIAGGICFGVALLVTLYGMWNSFRARITRIKVSLPNLPVAWKGKKIVFVSDLQLGNIYGEHFAQKVVEKIKALNPEVVFVGGDLYDGVKCDAPELIVAFRDLKPRLGTYFISGNHEYIRDSKSFFAAIEDAGMMILDNEKVDLEGIQLIGVDFNQADVRQDFADILADLDIDPDEPSILLKHVPEYLDIAEQFGISLTLCGHTHRGQFFPLSFVTRYIYKGYDYSLKRLGDMWVYTSSGVGAWMSPFRFGTRSEIVEIELV